MTEHPVINSSAISDVSYDRLSGELSVKFKDGSFYQYISVPLYEYTGFIASVSMGRYFNQFIRNRYSTK